MKTKCNHEPRLKTGQAIGWLNLQAYDVLPILPCIHCGEKLIPGKWRVFKDSPKEKAIKKAILKK